MKITHQHLLELLSYEPETGDFRWKVDGFRRGPGKLAGTLQKTGSAAGYTYITVAGHKYRAHRLAWFYVYGVAPGLIDHIDGNKSNNSIRNLRVTTQRQNCYNTKRSSRNKSGHKGVCWDKSKGKWMASIRLSCGKQKTIGRYDSKDDAAAAWREVALRDRGEFLRLE